MKIKHGWQYFVFVGRKYTVKVPIPSVVIYFLVFLYFKNNRKDIRLSKVVKELVVDRQRSVQYLREDKKLCSLCKIVYIGNFTCIQETMTPVSDLVENGSFSTATILGYERILRSIAEEGYIEKTGKFAFNFGVVDDIVYLMDWGEINKLKGSASEINRSYISKSNYDMLSPAQKIMFDDVLDEKCLQELQNYYENKKNSFS